jgi:uncharacterized FlaG/YvyC family protein
MEHGLTPIGGTSATNRFQPVRKAGASPSAATSGDQPPAALQAEYQAAAKAIEELAAQQVNLHFEVDSESNKVRVQVLDHDGRVMREIPARSLLDMLSGGGLLIDERG